MDLLSTLDTKNDRKQAAILARRRNSFYNDKIETNMDSNSYKIFVGLPRKNKARTGECN